MICTKLSPWKLVSFVQIDASNLDYWLTKFIQEVAKPSKERYQAKMFLFFFMCVEIYVVHRGKVFNPLDASDKSNVTLCVTFQYLF